MAVIKGGYPVYGQDVGIIMLDCGFPRPPGDIGNAHSFPFPVRYEVLEGISAAHLTKQEDPNAVAALVNAAKRLERSGVRVILTSCGLFLRYQERLAAAVKVPVATSAVLFLPFLRALLPPGRKVGVLTADATTLSPILSQAGWNDPEQVIVAGMENCPVFRRAILDPAPPFELDSIGLEHEVLGVAEDLLRRESNIAALLLECTNLPPYSRLLRQRSRLPVFDVIDLAYLLQKASSA